MIRLLPVVALLILALSGCRSEPEYETFLPSPKWLSSAGLVTLDTADDVAALWQSEPRCCVDESLLEVSGRTLYRSCHSAIARHPRNEALVVKCLQLMDTRIERADRMLINRHLVENYPDHRDRTDNCHNCSPADTIANATRDLAWQERHSGNLAVAISLLENVLDTRFEEMTAHVQIDLYATLARFYTESEPSDTGISRISAAYSTLEPHRDASPAATKHFKRFERTYLELNEGR